MTTKATETRLPCSKETRKKLSEHKRSPENWDTTLRRLARLADAVDLDELGVE